MASTVWKGYLTFGLISVPIGLFAAARREHISFNMLHKACGARIRQQTYCPTCDRVVERAEIVKGYEQAKDSYIEIDPEELKKIEPPSARNMEILQFVRLEEVDPLYFDASYYAVPEEPGRKAYALLVRSLEAAGYAALAKVAMHNREYIVIVRPRSGGLTLHTLYYPDELHQVSEYGQPQGVEVSEQEIELARRLIQNLAAPFQPEEYHDEYQAQVRKLIESKAAGTPVQPAKAPRMAPVIDLMEALQRSLAAVERKPPARAAEAAPAEAPPARKRAAAKRKAG